MSRPEIDERTRDVTINEASHHMDLVVADKGSGSFVSSHEILGAVTEEYQELIEAVGDKNARGVRNSPESVRHELLDVAIACLWGVASIDAGVLDW